MSISRGPLFFERVVKCPIAQISPSFTKQQTQPRQMWKQAVEPSGNLHKIAEQRYVTPFTPFGVATAY